ncbi:Fur family transcriptional regulator [Nocardia carnea]|uniref:Fur family transcriptional regulator n=1 Tax=Nocardia carnea TaxID=37328 RepID=UPI0024563031|nr:transcriptional repressor [Nocardia carnea]
MIGEQVAAPGMRRWTRQRELIVSTLDAQGGFTTVQELHTRLRLAGHSIGISTVYRTLAELDRAQHLDVVRQETGERRYQLRRSSVHRHHLICRTCGYSTVLDADVVEAWIGGLPTITGFTDIAHTLELDGVCVRCRST